MVFRKGEKGKGEGGGRPKKVSAKEEGEAQKSLQFLAKLRANPPWQASLLFSPPLSPFSSFQAAMAEVCVRLFPPPPPVLVFAANFCPSLPLLSALLLLSSSHFEFFQPLLLFALFCPLFPCRPPCQKRRGGSRMEWREREESATIPVYCLIKSSLSGRPPPSNSTAEKNQLVDAAGEGRTLLAYQYLRRGARGDGRMILLASSGVKWTERGMISLFLGGGTKGVTLSFPFCD